MASSRVVSPFDLPCPGLPQPVRHWYWPPSWRAIRGHRFYVQWRHQRTSIESSGRLLALDAGSRKPECVIRCEHCEFEEQNGQAPVATAMYALHDAGEHGLARLVGAAHVARGSTTGGRDG